MTFEEIFKALYGDGTLNRPCEVDEASLLRAKRARAELVNLSDEEWNDWIDYRRDHIKR